MNAYTLTYKGKILESFSVQSNNFHECGGSDCCGDTGSPVEIGTPLFAKRENLLYMLYNSDWDFYITQRRWATKPKVVSISNHQLQGKFLGGSGIDGFEDVMAKAGLKIIQVAVEKL